MSKRDELVQTLEPYVAELGILIGSPRLPFSSLQEDDVPEEPGLYVIYCEEPLETSYVGKSHRRRKESASGQPDGLRFRIMKNHLAYQGNDNLVRYIMEEFRLESRSAFRDYFKRQYAVHWLVVENLRHLFLLEHLAIAALSPRFNRG